MIIGSVMEKVDWDFYIRKPPDARGSDALQAMQQN